MKKFIISIVAALIALTSFSAKSSVTASAKEANQTSYCDCTTTCYPNGSGGQTCHTTCIGCGH